MGLGAPILEALDDAIAGIAGCVACRTRFSLSESAVVRGLWRGESDDLSFSIDISSDGDQTDILSCAGSRGAGRCS